MSTKKSTDHVAAGWNADHTLRWIEVGRLRLEESEKDGATVLSRTVVSEDQIEVYGPTWLSSTELAGLSCQLIDWFSGDLVEKICEIEGQAKDVKRKLEAWNDRARVDEEHPPYDDLTRSLEVILARCSELREVPALADGKRGPDEP